MTDFGKLAQIDPHTRSLCDAARDAGYDLGYQRGLRDGGELHRHEMERRAAPPEGAKIEVRVVRGVEETTAAFMDFMAGRWP